MAARRKSAKALAAAVRQCVAECSAGGMLVTRLAEFVVRLRQRGWHDDDVHQVELAALRILAGISQRDDDDAGGEEIH
jgi:hypothetical protein